MGLNFREVEKFGCAVDKALRELLPGASITQLEVPADVERFPELSSARGA